MERSAPELKVAVIEHHSLLRECLLRVCKAEKLIAEAFPSATSELGIASVLTHRASVVLLELNMPVVDGFQIIDSIRKCGLRPGFIAITSVLEPYTVYRVEKAMLRGFLDKLSCDEEIVSPALRAVCNGSVFFSSHYQRMKQERVTDPKSFDKILTERELEILTLLGAPLRDEEIAQRLDLSDKTCQKHRFNMLKKLGLRTTAELERYARAHGIVDASVYASEKLNVHRGVLSPL